MKISQSLMSTIKKSSTDFTFDIFKNVISELNFKDKMPGVFGQGENEDGKWNEVMFDNSWRLIVWDDGDISIVGPNINDGDSIYAVNYKNLLKFMEKKGIRKDKECEYKDAELYIVNFEK